MNQVRSENSRVPEPDSGTASDALSPGPGELIHQVSMLGSLSWGCQCQRAT